MLCAAALIAAVSCTKDVRTEDNDSSDVKLIPMAFSAGVQTKAQHVGNNAVYWSDGDAISLCSGVAERNVGFEFTTTLAQPSETAVFKGYAPELSSYRAVYPYSSVDHWQSNGEALVYVTVPAQQKAVKGTFDPKACILAAMTESDRLQFSHVCSYLKFTIGEDSPSVCSVTVSTEGESVSGICYVDMRDSSPAFGHENTKNNSVVLSREDGGILEAGDYYITMFPLTYSNGLSMTVLCDGGGQFTKKIESSLTFKSGKVYNAGTITRQEVKTPFNLLDVYSEEGTPKGIVFYVSEDGMTAKILSLDRSAAVAWSTDGTHTIGTKSTSDGQANTALLRASEEAASIPALAFCDDHGEGWYWPALNELQAVFEAYNGTKYSASTNAVPKDINEAEKASRAAFDKVLTDNGGTAINLAGDEVNGDAYWSSTEQTKEGVVYGSSFRFGKRYASGAGDKQVKTNATRYIRCCKVVTK